MQININVPTKIGPGNQISFCGKGDYDWIKRLAKCLLECLEEYRKIRREVNGIIKIANWTVFVANNYDVLAEQLFEKKVFTDKDGKQHVSYVPRKDGIERTYALLKENNLI